MSFHTWQTGAGNIGYTLAPSEAFQLEEVRLHLSAVGAANDFSIALDSDAGAAYDAVLNTQDMTSVTDEVYQPGRPQMFAAGDKLVFAWTNTNSVTWGLEIVTR